MSKRKDLCEESSCSTPGLLKLTKTINNTKSGSEKMYLSTVIKTTDFKNTKTKSNLHPPLQKAAKIK